MKQLTAMILFFAVPLVSIAQAVSGVILDASNDTPIPYAHIALGEVVSVTNSNGEFILSGMSDHDTLLHVSFIGYYPKEVNLNLKSYHKIYLEPSTTELDEVQVWTGEALVNEVLDRRMFNYDLDNLQMTSYYKEKLTDESGALFYLAEGILDIYHPFRVSADETIVRPIRTRKKVVRSLEENQITFISGHAYDMVDPSIWREDSFLSEKNRDDYEFQYVSRATFGEHDVYVVIFRPKNNKGYVSGKLFIEDETFAIVRMEYQPDPSVTNFWTDVLWVEEYMKVRGIYELTTVSFHGGWQELGQTYQYEAILVNNNIESASNTPKGSGTLGKKDIFFKSATYDFTDEFWAGYNFLKLTGEEKE